mmetsp:Transcript_12851/g.39534  ORF Transcript_12851/g.39534 Transcript_12851/m.39534 type:complete len:245 (+) Transcript_12851:1951-2685(+)
MLSFKKATSFSNFFSKSLLSNTYTTRTESASFAAKLSAGLSCRRSSSLSQTITRPPLPVAAGAGSISADAGSFLAAFATTSRLTMALVTHPLVRVFPCAHANNLPRCSVLARAPSLNRLPTRPALPTPTNAVACGTMANACGLKRVLRPDQPCSTLLPLLSRLPFLSPQPPPPSCTPPDCRSVKGLSASDLRHHCPSSPSHTGTSASTPLATCHAIQTSIIRQASRRHPSAQATRRHPLLPSTT